eukprot:TRINITY_DN10474_c0_g1_i1.p2 TRINITY_DN10474_c0_g1~~TRINITY_DN10474_c0_g1_i1.p2  ORF type:complete len:214 (+),score=38.34 TRINITY_DN10474_c0_g1_i1:112-753(+)
MLRSLVGSEMCIRDRPQPGYAPHPQPGYAPHPVVQQVVVSNECPDLQVVQGQFAAGLCDCCTPGCGTCCWACCCASCAFGDLASLLDPNDHCCGGNYGGACCLHYMLGGFMTMGLVVFTGIYVPTFNWIATCPMRGAVRNKYQIDGDECSDCLLAWCCDPCTIVQQTKEVRLRSSVPQANAVFLQPGMVTQPQMQHHCPQPGAEPLLPVPAQK